MLQDLCVCREAGFTAASYQKATGVLLIAESDLQRCRGLASAIYASTCGIYVLTTFADSLRPPLISSCCSSNRSSRSFSRSC